MSPTEIDDGSAGLLRVFKIFAYAALCYGGYFLAMSLFALSWPSTSGKILSSSLRTYELQREPHPSYRALISYEYSVEGKTFNSKRVSFDPTFTYSWPDVQSLVNRFPVGASVPVQYNPWIHSQSILQTSRWLSYMTYGLIALMPQLFLIPFRRMKKSVLPTPPTQSPPVPGWFKT